MITHFINTNTIESVTIISMKKINPKKTGNYIRYDGITIAEIINDEIVIIDNNFMVNNENQFFFKPILKIFIINDSEEYKIPFNSFNLTGNNIIINNFIKDELNENFFNVYNLIIKLQSL